MHFVPCICLHRQQTKLTHLSHPEGKFVYLVNRHKSVHIIKQEDIMENGDKKGQGAIQHSCGDTHATVPRPLSHLFLHSLALSLLFLHQQSFSQHTRQAGHGHRPRCESCPKKQTYSTVAKISGIFNATLLFKTVLASSI